MKPVVIATCEKHGIDLIITDLEEHGPYLFVEHAVRSTPTTIFWDDHENAIARRTGAMSQKDFQEFVEGSVNYLETNK